MQLQAATTKTKTKTTTTMAGRGPEGLQLTLRLRGGGSWPAFPGEADGRAGGAEASDPYAHSRALGRRLQAGDLVSRCQHCTRKLERTDPGAPKICPSCESGGGGGGGRDPGFTVCERQPAAGYIEQRPANPPPRTVARSTCGYVPPAMRRGAATAGGASLPSALRREEGPTLKLTNLSLDALEADVRELCRPFGALRRVSVLRDRATGCSRGVAYVGFERHADAEAAQGGLDGHGYDNLVVRAEWADHGGGAASSGRGRAYGGAYSGSAPQPAQRTQPLGAPVSLQERLLQHVPERKGKAAAKAARKLQREKQQREASAALAALDAGKAHCAPRMPESSAVPEHVAAPAAAVRWREGATALPEGASAAKLSAVALQRARGLGLSDEGHAPERAAARVLVEHTADLTAAGAGDASLGRAAEALSRLGLPAREVLALAEAQLSWGARSARVTATTLQELYNGAEDMEEEEVEAWWQERRASTQKGVERGVVAFVEWLAEADESESDHD